MRILTPNSLRALWLPIVILAIGAGEIAAAAHLLETEERLTDDVKVLASDEYEGRGVGTEGLNLAGEYVANAFAEAGLNVSFNGDGPFQEFTITTGAELAEPNVLKIQQPGGELIEFDEMPPQRLHSSKK